MMYETKNTLIKNLRIFLVAFHSGFIGYSLFTNLEGYKWLHSFTLRYLEFFINNLNYLNLGLAFSLSLLIILYFLVTFTLYFLFDYDYKNTKNYNVRNIMEILLNIFIGIGISGFGISIFSPYLKYIRPLYNNYHLMLGIEIMLITIILILILLLNHYLWNSYVSPIKYIKDIKLFKNEVDETYSFNNSYDDIDYEDDGNYKNLKSAKLKNAL